MTIAHKIAATAHKLRRLHEDAHALAFDFYLRKGHVPQRLMEIAEATKSFETFLAYTAKYSPDQPRVPAGNHGGGRWTNGGDGGDGSSPFINVAVDDPPIQPAYPLESAILAFFSGGLSVEEGLAVGASEDATEAVAPDAGDVTQKLLGILMPGGEPIGDPGSSPEIRELPGGADAAEQMFQDLTENGTPYTPPSYNGIDGYKMPDGSWIGYGPDSGSGEPTIDLNIPALGKTLGKLKFLDGGNE